jgi:hypothetical protein
MSWMTMPEVDDRSLLRRFEPIIRYTQGERFFPMKVDPYLERSSLWCVRPKREAELIVPQGELTPERLAQPLLGEFDAVYFLRFITPLNLAELAAYRLQQGLQRKDERYRFRAGSGRLARVGYASRFVDALFQLSLLARGRVPGDTAAAAALAYDQIMAEDPYYGYYGRIVRQNGWLVLQYWYFYPFNNWRSGFFGANDHEADWEMVCIYLSESEIDGSVHPEWVAYAVHDYAGDDLRRRWDDPEVDKVGEHPVVYSGAGSHASYFRAGEYLAELELPFLAPLVRITEQQERFWRRMLRRYVLEEGAETRNDSFNIFRVPFVDYARGDGLSIGPGQEREWDELHLLDPTPIWAKDYRGLWGLFAHDPFSGEDAPAGPLYNRDGTVRRAWYDPTGWAGLDKIPPPGEALAYVLAERDAVAARRDELAREIARKSQDLLGLGVRLRAMQDRPHLELMYTAHDAAEAILADEIAAKRAEYADDESLLQALDLYAERLRAGLRGPMRAHVRRGHEPVSELSLRFARFAEIWAAASIGLMLIAFVALFLFAPEFRWHGLVLLLSLFIFVEAGFRRQLPRLVSTVTILLAIVAAGVLLFEFFWTAVVSLVVLAGAYIMWENLRELWT